MHSPVPVGGGLGGSRPPCWVLGYLLGVRVGPRCCSIRASGPICLWGWSPLSRGPAIWYDQFPSFNSIYTFFLHTHMHTHTFKQSRQIKNVHKRISDANSLYNKYLFVMSRTEVHRYIYLKDLALFIKNISVCCDTFKLWNMHLQTASHL